jgi:hypothetical protein
MGMPTTTPHRPATRRDLHHLGNVPGKRRRRRIGSGAPTDTPADDTFDESALESAWDKLRPVVAGILTEMSDQHSYAALPGSSLVGDDKRTGEFATSTAVMVAMSAAADCLQAAGTLADAPIRHVSAPHGLARIALENAATGLWLLSPPQRPERICRTLRWWTQNHRDRMKFHTAAGRDQTEADNDLASTLRDIQNTATTNHIAATDATRKITVTAILEAAGNAHLLMWIMCSGLAHGRVWAHLSGLDREISATDRPGSKLARTTNNRATTLMALCSAGDLLVDLDALVRARAGHPRRWAQ